MLDLCLDKQLTNEFQRMSTAIKTAFTKAYNAVHKVPAAKKGGKRGAATAEDSEAEESSDDDAFGILNEDELAELKRAKKAEKEQQEMLKAQKGEVNEFTMIKASLAEEEQATA